MADEMARLEAVVRGRVQGVGFRYLVLDFASEIGLTGWVANERDGSLRPGGVKVHAGAPVIEGEPARASRAWSLRVSRHAR